mgnify:CR=1 FL=1
MKIEKYEKKHKKSIKSKIIQNNKYSSEQCVLYYADATETDFNRSGVT